MLTEAGMKRTAVALGLLAGLLAGLLVHPQKLVAEDATPAELTSKTINTALHGVTRMAFSHDGHLLAFLGYASVASTQASVTVFDARSRQLIRSLPVANASGVLILKGGIAFSPDDSRLAFGAKEITVWDVGSWTVVAQVPGPFANGPFAADDLLGLAYTQDGQRIIAAYGRVWGPGDIKVWGRDDVVTLSTAARLARRNGQIPAAFQHPEVDVMDATTGMALKRIPIVRTGARGDHSLITSGLAVSEDGRAAYVALSDWEGLTATPPPRIMVARADLDHGQVSIIYERRQDDDFTALAVSSDQSSFATGEMVGNKHGWRAEDGTWVSHETTDPVRIWNTSDGSLSSQLGPPIGAVRQLAFLQGRKGVFACQSSGKNNLMAVWDTKTRSMSASLNVETPRVTAASCVVSPSGLQAVLTVPTGEVSNSRANDTAYLTNLSAPDH